MNIMSSMISPAFSIKNLGGQTLKIVSTIPEATGPIMNELPSGEEMVFMEWPTSTTIIFTRISPVAPDEDGAEK